jgi:hypothetical protein
MLSRRVEGQGRSVDSTITGGEETCDLLYFPSGNSRCEAEGTLEDIDDGVARESVEDDKDGGEFGFGGARLTELERLAVEPIDTPSCKDVIPGGVTGKNVEGHVWNDCRDMSSSQSLSTYNVATGTRLVPVGARGSGRLP